MHALRFEALMTFRNFSPGTMKLPGEFFLWGTEQTFRGVFTLGVGGPTHYILP
jgi:hypothetical protein